MTKLSGTSGQLFSGLAESLGMSGTSRFAKNVGDKPSADSSFNDLLHTVSKLAKRALEDQGGDTAAKVATLRRHLVRPTGSDAAETPDCTESASEKASGRKADKSPTEQSPVELTEQAGVQSRTINPVIAGQEIVAAPAVRPLVKDVSGADEQQSTARRGVQGASVAKAADPAPPGVAPTAPRSQGASSTAAQPESMQGGVSPNTLPVAQGFEAVTANVERAARASARDALPEATRVTVVQQETHLPPAQFNAPQQVANAVVAELRETPAPAGAAASDLLTPQGNAPDQPLKILTINLEPPSLGNVTVRLRLVGTEVSVHLAAERKDTSQMLDQQRDSIRDLMQSAGYVADVAPVQHGSLDGFQNGSGQPQSQLSGQQQPPSQSLGMSGGAGGSSGQSDGSARQARQERPSNQETRHDQDVGPHLRRGPVYL